MFYPPWPDYMGFKIPSFASFINAVDHRQGRRRRSIRSCQRRTTFLADYAIRHITFMPFQPLLSCLPVIYFHQIKDAVIRYCETMYERSNWSIKKGSRTFAPCLKLVCMIGGGGGGKCQIPFLTLAGGQMSSLVNYS